jgi:hypothetical protein
MKPGIAALALAAALSLGACSSLNRVSAAELVGWARKGGLDTAYATRVLAITDERAYVEKRDVISSSSAKVSVLWAPVAELTPAELAELRGLAAHR